MGRAFEYRKATKLKRWGNMARVFTKLGKQITIAAREGGPDPDGNPRLRMLMQQAKKENMPKDNVERAIKKASSKDEAGYKEINYEGYGPHGIAIFVETAKQSMFSNVMTIFKAFRGLRIPYVIIKENCEKIDFSNILVPVTYLPEEKEKAPYSCNMGRFLRSNIIVLQAKDYGSKTPANVKAITAFYDKFNLRYTVRQASKDSYKVEKEAVMKAKAENAGMVVISTSRDYGLDDMIFGPKEEHLFKIAEVPLMCINPRGDLYVLCW